MLEDLLSPRPTQPAAGGKVLVNWGRGEGWAVLFALCGGGTSAFSTALGKSQEEVCGAQVTRYFCARSVSGGPLGVATIRSSPASTALDRALCGPRRCSRWGFPWAGREVS
jgi:hypothetical protein